ncbi:MAG: Na/Pi cotransporter family protein [Lachnospiraceae bacterium]|nr:Na/Pi cotransporter family protein [Lachnospiraceae bacterium]
MNFSNILSLGGGLGLFLFGMTYMGDGLERAAGSKMKDLMEKLTRNPFFGFLLGMLVTAVIQSSSATTVMTMGMINAGIMDLAQATGVIIGANIGTTMTSILIALDVSALAPACIFTGALLMLYSKKPSYKHIGQIILGFGLLFQGLHTMSGAMSSLKDLPAFQNFITTATNPVLGLLFGILMCAVIQSSSASVGVLQALAMQGLMPIHFASFLICGINIGSSMPPFLASINAKNNAKRAACIYFIYNVIGALIFMPVTMFTPYTDWLATLSPYPVVQVSFCHIIFKVVTALLTLPFTNGIVKLAFKFVPKVEHESELRFLYIDDHLIRSPSVAITQAFKEIERMAGMTRENFIMATEGLINNDVSKSAQIQEKEEVIDYLNENITEFLVKVTALELSDPDSQVIGNMFHVLNDLERIGDHSASLCKKTQVFVDKQLIYSEAAKEEIAEIYQKCLILFDESVSAFMRQRLTKSQAKKLTQLDETIDALTIRSQDNHIARLRAQQCHTEPGVIFAKALHDLERVGDYSINVAFAARRGSYMPHEI